MIRRHSEKNLSSDAFFNKNWYYCYLIIPKGRQQSFIMQKEEYETLHEKKKYSTSSYLL